MRFKFIPGLFAILFLLLSACKNDKTPPVITLVGGSSIELASGVPAADPGATANDDKDGDLTSRIKSDWAGVVNTDVEATYLVTYSVMDNNRNQDVEERTVIVKFGAGSLAGQYEATYTENGGPPVTTFTTNVSGGSAADQCVINPF